MWRSAHKSQQIPASLQGCSLVYEKSVPKPLLLAICQSQGCQQQSTHACLSLSPECSVVLGLPLAICDALRSIVKVLPEIFFSPGHSLHGILAMLGNLWVNGGVLCDEVLQDERWLVLAARFLASSITERSLRLQLYCAASVVLLKI